MASKQYVRGGESCLGSAGMRRRRKNRRWIIVRGFKTSKAKEKGSRIVLASRETSKQVTGQNDTEIRKA